MTTKRIGVLLVHGIGSQKPNEHLVAETRKIVAAMGEQVAAISVVAEPKIADKVPDAFVPDYAANMVRVEVVTWGSPPRQLCLEFNEVYWGDLGEKPTLPNQVKFWFWALSIWSVAARDFTRLVGFKDMYIPENGNFRQWYRVLLAVYGILFLLGALTVGLLNVIADRLKLPRVPISDLLTDYLGDVMLYSRNEGDDDPVVSDLAQPPRVAIRGRMVDALVEFALRDYDQWYLLAHSQGAVVAYNGLMETEQALPNFLTERRWTQVREAYANLVASPQLQPPLVDVMLPRRPQWLAPTDAIDRRALFAKLRGFLTYGAAIGKFRAIWPVVVPANRDEHVFPSNFGWFNIYDRTDPVAGSLEAYGPGMGLWNPLTQRQDPAVPQVSGGKRAAKIDESISYKAGWIWLLSHLQYLDYRSPGYWRPEQLLVLKVAAWLRGDAFDAAGLKSAEPWVWPRYVLRLFELIVIGAAVWLASSGLIAQLLSDKWHGVLQWLMWPVLATAAVAIAVVFNGVGWLIGKTGLGDPPRSARIVIMVLGMVLVGAATCGGWHYARELVDYVRACPFAMIIAHLIDHVAPSRLAIGFLGLTILLIVVLGSIRWLFQALPVQRNDSMKGLGAD